MERQVLILTTVAVLIIAKSSAWTVKTDRRHKRACECSLVLPYSPSEHPNTHAESKTCSVRSDELVELRKDVGLLQKVQIGERMRCNSFAGQLGNVTALMFQLEDHAHQQETYRAYYEKRLEAFSEETLQLHRVLTGQGNFIKFLEDRVGVLQGDLGKVSDLNRRVEALTREETEKREETSQKMDEFERRIQVAEESTNAFLWLMTETLSKIPAAERKIMEELKKTKTPIAGSAPSPERLNPQKPGSVDWVYREHAEVEDDYILDVRPR
ncbi:Hypp3722 [Branchiostoma lanceolatum]|uniref:Hypp3722 protein n=1 Tax=Branchiostoma lanceolatum TaxID=7740 RepID=A0A8K0EUV6_BRALA|nr:Hypp3722 [Branchiostoma lanceolatum]